jgi:hypothetical protein
MDYKYGGNKTGQNRKTLKKRKFKKSGKKTHYKNSKKRGGQFINRFKTMSILPKCNDTPPYILNNTWDGRRISDKYKDTYADSRMIKNILMELQKKSIEIALELRYNCPLLKNYLIFWNNSKNKLIDWYKLGAPSKNKRRLIYFLIKMHNGEPLSPELQKKWDEIDSTRPLTDHPVDTITLLNERLPENNGEIQYGIIEKNKNAIEPINTIPIANQL